MTNKSIYSLACLPTLGRFIIGGNYAAYWSDDGISWNKVSIVDSSYSGAGNDTYYQNTAVYINELDKLFITSYNSNGVAFTSDGLTWNVQHPNGSNGMFAPTYISEINRLISGEINGGVIYSDNGGTSWTYKNMQSNTYKPCGKILFNTANKKLYARDRTNNTNILVSEDNGMSWNLLKTMPTELNIKTWVYISEMDRIVAATAGYTAIVSIDSEGTLHYDKKYSGSNYIREIHYFGNDNCLYVLCDNGLVGRIPLEELNTTNTTYAQATEITDYTTIGSNKWYTLAGI